VTNSILVDNGNPQTLKVGFIGFVPPQIMIWDRSNREGTVIAKDIVETAEKYVPEMKRTPIGMELRADQRQRDRHVRDLTRGRGVRRCIPAARRHGPDQRRLRRVSLRLLALMESPGESPGELPGDIGDRPTYTTASFRWTTAASSMA
jgi:hypothetical protein